MAAEEIARNFANGFPIQNPVGRGGAGTIARVFGHDPLL